MALTFPSSPTDGQVFTSGDLSFVYDATKGRWESTNFANFVPPSANVEISVPVSTVPLKTYTRDAEWLTLPTVTNTEEKLVALVAVWPDSDSNWFAIGALGTNYTVDWGDGNVVNYTAPANIDDTPSVHQYSFNDLSVATETTEGYRQAIITVTPQASGTFSEFGFSRTYDATTFPVKAAKNSSLRYVMNWLEIVISAPSMTDINFDNETMSGSLKYLEILSSSISNGSSLFFGASSVEKIIFNSSQLITTLFSTFRDCGNLLEIEFNADTSTCTNASQVFYDCYRLESIPTLDLSSATSTSGIFRNCYNLRDFSNVTFGSTITNAPFMFSKCHNLTVDGFPTTAIDLSGSVSINNLFEDCYNLSRIPSNITFSSSIQFANDVFSNCRKLAALPDLNLSSCDTCANMAQGCDALRSINNLDFSAVSNLSFAFSNCPNLTNVSINLSSATRIDRIFNGCDNLIEVTLTGQTSNCTNFASAFAGCYSLRKAPDLDFTLGSDLSSIYNTCKALVEIPAMTLPAVTNMDSAFFGCESLPSIEINITSTATKNSSAYRFMFYLCYSLREITGNFDISGSSDYSYLLANCFSLKSVPSLDLSSATSIFRSFWSCRQLNYLDFTPPTVACNYGNAFDSCYSLKSLPSIDFVNASSMSQTFSNFWSFADTAKLLNISLSTYITYNSFSRAGYLILFNNLPTVSGQTLLLTGGANNSELTAADIAIATNKGWTVSL